MISQINKDTRVVAPTHLRASILQDETILLDAETGQYFGLDGVARHIWDHLQSTRTVGELADLVQEAYDVDLDTCLADVKSFVRELADSGLITVVKS